MTTRRHKSACRRLRESSGYVLVAVLVLAVVVSLLTSAMIKHLAILKSRIRYEQQQLRALSGRPGGDARRGPDSPD